MRKLKNIILLIIILNLFSIFSFASLNNFIPKIEYEHNFKDMELEGWYFDYVKQCYELGIITGKTKKTFGINDNLTIAEAITLASRVHNIYEEGKVTFEITKEIDWYRNVINYAIEHEIIGANDFDNYEKYITKSEAAHIFAKVLPAEEIGKINYNITIPDITEETEHYDDILKLYESGILTGDSDGEFKPYNLIDRKEASVIICRIIKPEERMSLKEAENTGISNKLSATFTPTPYTYEELQNTKLPILCYHTVAENLGEYNPCIIRIDQFEEDMKLLKQSYCNTIFLSELIGFMEGKNQIPEKSVVITFDDGYSEVYKYVLPIIEKYDVKINLGLIGKNIDDRITSEEIIGLSQSDNVEFVSHTYNMHRNTEGGRQGALPKPGETEEQYKQKMTRDMNKIQTILYNITGKNSEAFVYPYGFHSEQTEKVLKDLGIKLTLTTIEGVNVLANGLYKLKRFNREPHYKSTDYINKILISMI